MSVFDEFRESRGPRPRQDPVHPANGVPDQASLVPPELTDHPEKEPPFPSPASRNAERRHKLTELRQAAHAQLLETFNLSALLQVSEEEIKTEIGNTVRQIIPRTNLALSRSERDRLIDELYYEVMGLGPLEILLKDDTVSDILINGPTRVLVERHGLIEITDVQFESEAHLRRIIQKVLGSTGRRLDESAPYVDARLPDGSRLNAVISPIALDGTLVSIRKRRRDRLNLEQIELNGTLDSRMAAYLRAAVASRLNILVSGGTGSGKTTMLNALSAYIGARERILTIEDTAELELQQRDVGRLESRPPNVEGKGAVTQRDCLRNALRMRPDRIIVGETRGDEVIDMLQAMNTGHNGSMTTIHANSGRDATLRIENMVAMAGLTIPLAALRRQIAGAIHIILHVERLQDGTRKIVSVDEVLGCEGDILTIQELFRYEQTGLTPEGRVEGRFVAAGVRSHFSEHFKRWNLGLPEKIFAEGP